MKRFRIKRRSFIFLSLLFSAYCVQAQVKHPDELIHKIFVSLQAKDEKAFLSLCPDSAQLVQIMKKYEQGEIAKLKAFLGKPYPVNANRLLKKFSTDLQKRHSPEEIQKLRNEFRESFNAIIKDGEKRGVDWATTTFTNYEFDSAKRTSFLYNQAPFDTTEFKSLSGKIFFKGKDSTCQIWFRDLLFIPEENRWNAGELDMLVLPGDKADVIEVQDVVVQSIQDEPPPPPYKRKKNKTSPTKKRSSKS